MKFDDIVFGFGIGGIIIIFLLIVFLPIIIATILGIAIANFFNISGIVWWCVVIFIALLFYGILYKLYKR